MLHYVLLELKKHLFYNWSENTGIDALCEHFEGILRSLIIKEKIIALYTDKYEKFIEKWKAFTDIYDYRGPDMPFIYS
jgi:hypothetical protein